MPGDEEDPIGHGGVGSLDSCQGDRKTLEVMCWGWPQAWGILDSCQGRWRALEVLGLELAGLEHGGVGAWTRARRRWRTLEVLRLEMAGLEPARGGSLDSCQEERRTLEVLERGRILNP